MPERERWLRHTVTELHPTWDRWLWGEEDCLELLREPHRWSRQLQQRWEEIPTVCNIPHRVAAYRADIIRLLSVWLYGGFYVDCDMFGVRNFEPLRSEELILMEFRPGHVGEGLIAAPWKSDHIEQALDNLCRLPVQRLMGLNLGPLCKQNKWKTFAPDYFCPHPRMNPEDLYRCTDDTYTIHCWRDFDYDRKRLMGLREKVTVRA